MPNYSWKARPNPWGRSEFNASFSIGFGNGLQSGIISLTSLLQGNIMGIFKFLDAVRIWWNYQYSTLHKSSTTVLLYHSWYALVRTEYVLVCTNMYQSTANLWVEGTSGIRVFASRCAPLNPVKQASVLYIQVCTGTSSTY